MCVHALRTRKNGFAIIFDVVLGTAVPAVPCCSLLFPWKWERQEIAVKKPLFPEIFTIGGTAVLGTAVADRFLLSF